MGPDGHPGLKVLSECHRYHTTTVGNDFMGYVERAVRVTLGHSTDVVVGI